MDANFYRPQINVSFEAKVSGGGVQQSPCTGCGDCVTGCNFGAKNTTLMNYLPDAVRHGAACVALTIDEEGMAKTAERKLAVARCIHDICVDEFGMDAGDLIFDTLTFTLATGQEEFRRSAVETIEGIRSVKRELPGVWTVLGVSNVSFGLTPPARAVLNSVFLHHAIEAGLDAAIVNPTHVRPIYEIPAAERELADDLILDRRPDAPDRRRPRRQPPRP
jgi:5-methyltetrahydrofolate--homocysteine methyltransferase